MPGERYQQRGKVESCWIIRVQSYVLISAYMRSKLPLSPPAEASVAGGEAVSGHRVTSSKTGMPIKPAGQHLTLGVLVRGTVSMLTL